MLHPGPYGELRDGRAGAVIFGRGHPAVQPLQCQIEALLERRSDHSILFWICGILTLAIALAVRWFMRALLALVTALVI
jgi:hypothetical protein